MPAETRHHTSGSLQLAIGLAASAGFVDAFVYERVAPVFVANMSGNLVRLGIAAGAHRGHVTAASVVALVGFAAGVVVGSVHLDARVRKGLPADPSTLLAFEAALMVVLVVLLRLAHVTYSPSVEPIDYPAILVGSTAMGLQAIALRRVGAVAVSTTYGTGAVVRLGEKLALGARRSDRPSDHRRRVSVIVLASVLFSYVAGAFAAASLPARPELLLIPVCVPLTGFVLLRNRTDD